MTLSAEDIVNKQFTSTKFRDGYDPDEVDDYLDEVVKEYRAIQLENEELKRKIGAAESRRRHGRAPGSSTSSAPCIRRPPSAAMSAGFA